MSKLQKYQWNKWLKTVVNVSHDGPANNIFVSREPLLTSVTQICLAPSQTVLWHAQIFQLNKRTINKRLPYFHLLMLFHLAVCFFNPCKIYFPRSKTPKT